MVIIQAPYPVLSQTLMLPNPRLEDDRQLAIQINYLKSINNTHYTYAKFNNIKEVSLHWTFINVEREKFDEFSTFLEQFCGNKWQITDWNGVIWRAIWEDPNLQYSFIGRGGACYTGRKERANFSLALRAIQLGATTIIQDAKRGLYPVLDVTV